MPRQKGLNLKSVVGVKNFIARSVTKHYLGFYQYGIYTIVKAKDNTLLEHKLYMRSYRPPTLEDVQLAIDFIEQD